MPVNLISPKHLLAVEGVTLGVAQAGVRKSGRDDVLLMTWVAGSHVAAVFTQNAFCAAPVLVCKKHLAHEGSQPRALLVNTGCANAGTGEQGIHNAQLTCDALAKHLQILPEQVLPFSTGVIMEHLPAEKINLALPKAMADLKADNWVRAAHAIMTTDIVAKGISRQFELDGVTVTMTGIAKGSGMIKPNMATMLAYIATDATIEASTLHTLLTEVMAESFNCISVDGDTSTNDACVLIATNTAQHLEIRHDSPLYHLFKAELLALAIELAQAIVRDGEGASKFVSVTVTEGQSVAECKQVAYAIAHSPLVKTAFFASDPNLGRILSAIGNAGVVGLNIAAIQVFLDDVLVAECGGRAQAYHEAQGKAVLQQAEFSVRVKLGRGEKQATIWTCDFSYDYVRINAEYRS